MMPCFADNRRVLLLLLAAVAAGLAANPVTVSTARAAVVPEGVGRSDDPSGVKRQQLGGQVTGGFQLTPTRTVETLQPGKPTTLELTIVNQTGQRASFQLVPMDLAPGRGNDYSRLEAAGAAERGAGAWLDPAADTIELRNLEQAVVDITARAPGRAGAGGYYGAIVVRMVGDTTSNTDTVSITTQIAAHYVLLVPGEIQYEAQLRDVSVPARITWGSVDVTAELVNTGNIHTAPALVATWKPSVGTAHEINTEIPELMPGGSRTIEASWDDPPIFGRITPTLRLELENGDAVEERAPSVWVVSWAGLGMVAAPLVLLTIAFWLWRRNRDYRRFLSAEFERALEADDDVDDGPAEP